MTRTPFRRLAFGALRRWLFLWVRSETIHQSAFDLKLDPTLPIIYVLQQTAVADLAVMDAECAKAELPRPILPLALGKDSEPHSYFTLDQGPGWFGRKRKPNMPPRLQRVIDAVAQGQVSDAQIVPVTVFWGQSPRSESSAWKLIFADSWAVTGRLRKLLAIFILGRKTRVQFSTPLRVSELLAHEKDRERTVRMAHRLLRVHFHNIKTSVIGPDLSHRRNLVKGLLYSPLVRQVINEEASREKISVEKAEKRALSYANEVASDYSYIAIRFLEVVLKWFWNKIYDGIDVHNLDEVQQVAQGSEIIYVPCHRSHIDYLLLSYLLFTRGLNPPHIAAGINLNMPVVGSLLRRGGAFFMRRSFKDNRLYTAIFNEYLHTLYGRGFPVEFFVEGGRSRTGRTLLPRPGMLAITLRSFLRSSRKPIVFVPVYIGYERVLEGRTYLGELRGASKKKESVFDIFRVLGALKQRFGRVSVNFGQPIHLGEFLDQQRPGWRDEDHGEQFRPDWLNSATNQLGSTIAQRINAAAAINPVNLVALALLSTPRHALDETSLCQLLDLYLGLLRRQSYSAHTSLPAGDGQALISHVEGLDLIERQKDALGDILLLDEQNAVQLTYYRNNILHALALPALLASFFQSGQSISRAEVQRLTRALYPFLQAELFIRWSLDELDAVIDQWLDALIEQGLILQQDQQLQAPEASSREYVLLNLLSRAISQTLQRFYMAIALLVNHGQNTLDAAGLETLCTVMAQRLSILHGLNAPEFFDKSLFRHFIATLIAQGVVRAGDDGLLAFHDELSLTVESAAKRVLPAELRLSIRQVANKQAHAAAPAA
ncbi:glycerol-3-phosphate 1-O-acyltransferase PlsB [Atopomonas sediminilitoris]|uniref:glycerol-3-phosphate 1-O-acyltransferase PlsB n=1 Tax=Atopomonas sediminilitoris TaxID=2919919 RepID=UPI001F4ED1C5|nr:glycerol-3-phosphate 1-O-acyltransferase PlsB [Atopomonas sediminilitoris]MCJ8168860.1 glycerol-3-phosphate 1-O-acyltransferase PlsB [Atopomonas sediminilitoris]